MFLAKSMKFKWGLTFYMIQKHLQSFLTLHLLHPWGCAPYTNQFVIICKAKTFYMGFFLLGEEGVRQKDILPILETLPRNTGTGQDLGNHTRIITELDKVKCPDKGSLFPSQLLMVQGKLCPRSVQQSITQHFNKIVAENCATHTYFGFL